MRLWSLHPKYLDRQGLTASWREALLAQAVLRNKTRGYRSHPQLNRFRESGKPLAMIAWHLREIAAEAARRGYAFDRTKIIGRSGTEKIPVSRGQLLFEWQHLRRKLGTRSPDVFKQWREVASPDAHPMFRVVSGGIAEWERGARS